MIAAEGPNGPYAAELRRMVASFATRDRLRTATHVNVFESDRWMFHKAVDVDGKLQRHEIPVTGGAVEQEFKTDGSTHVAQIVKNPSIAADNANKIVDTFLPSSSFFSQSESVKQAQIEAAVRIENPLIHSPSTQDCVGCHVVTRALNRVGRNLGDTGGNFRDTYTVPSGINGQRVLNQDENIWAIRAFGFFRAEVSITKGTINDSAKVAGLLNAVIDGRESFAD